jgi:Ca2+-binding EF-hand superfamily protein
MHPKTAAAAWKELDAKHQGYLTREDLTAEYSKIDFDKADTNHNGKLTKSEFNAAYKEAYGSSTTGSRASEAGTTQGFSSGSTMNTPSPNADTSKPEDTTTSATGASSSSNPTTAGQAPKPKSPTQ